MIEHQGCDGVLCVFPSTGRGFSSRPDSGFGSRPDASRPTRSGFGERGQPMQSCLFALTPVGPGHLACLHAGKPTVHRRSRSRSRSPPPRMSGASDITDREKASERSHSPKSRAAEYGVRVPHFSFVSVERDYLELVRRYPRLAIPADFSKVRAQWTQAPPGVQDSFGISMLRVDKPVRFEHDLDIMRESGNAVGEIPQEAGAGTGDRDSDNTGKAKREHRGVAQAGSTDQPGSSGVQYAVRVLLLQGLSQADRNAILLGPHHDGGSHMVHSLKFVTMRAYQDGSKRAGTPSALGGPWSAELDGGDPARCCSAVKAGVCCCFRGNT